MNKATDAKPIELLTGSNSIQMITAIFSSAIVCLVLVSTVVITIVCICFHRRLVRRGMSSITSI